MIEPLRSVKLVVYPPLASPLVACTALVWAPAVVHVTTVLLPCDTAEMIRKSEAGFVGLRPARNWLVLLMPLPSGSASGCACGQLVHPKYCSCHAWNAVSTVIRLFDTTVLVPSALLAVSVTV